MKTLITFIFLCLFNLSFSQSKDTLAISNQVIEDFNKVIRKTPKLEIINNNITLAKELYTLKNNKVDLSYVLGTMYYILGTRYTRPVNPNRGIKSKGYLSPEQRTKALNEAKKHYSYYIKNTSEKGDDIYRACQNGLIEIDKRLENASKKKLKNYPTGCVTFVICLNAFGIMYCFQ